MYDGSQARKDLDRLRALCEKAQKCQTLPAEDLKGKYRKSYEALHQEVVEAANKCLWHCMDGLQYHESVSTAADVGLRAVFDSPEYQGRREAATRWCWDGDFQALMEFYRWTRKQLKNTLEKCAGVVEEGSDELWT